MVAHITSTFSGVGPVKPGSRPSGSNVTSVDVRFKQPLGEGLNSAFCDVTNLLLTGTGCFQYLFTLNVNCYSYED